MNVMAHRLSLLFCLSAGLLIVHCTSDLDRGATALQLGDYPLAIALYQKKINRNPECFQARLGMGKALIQKMIDNPEDSSAWKSALINLEAAKILKSSDVINGLLSQVWMEHGRRALANADTLSGLESITKAITYDPENPELFNMAGIIYFRLGETAKARILFTKALTFDSTSVSVLFNLGMLCWNEGEITGAHENWYRALKSAPQDPDILYWFAQSEKQVRDQK